MSLFYPIPCPKTSEILKFAEWRNIGRSNSQSCAAKMAAFPVSALAHTPDWDSRLPGGGISSHRACALPCAAKMAAFPVSGGVPWEVPLGVGGPPAMDFIFWRAGQDTQDTQDTHDGGKVGLRASGQEMACELAKGLRAYAPSRRSPGSLGCPGCLGQGVGARSGLAPTQPFARRQYAASNAVATSCDPPARQIRSRRDSPAPQASGCPTSEARSLAKQGRKRPSATLPVSGGI